MKKLDPIDTGADRFFKLNRYGGRSEKLGVHTILVTRSFKEKSFNSISAKYWG